MKWLFQFVMVVLVVSAAPADSRPTPGGVETVLIIIDNSGSMVPTLFAATIDKLATVTPELAVTLRARKIEVWVISDEFSIFNPTRFTVSVPTLNRDSICRLVQAHHAGMGLSGKVAMDSAVMECEVAIARCFDRVVAYIRSVQQTKAPCSALSQLFAIGIPGDEIPVAVVVATDLNTSCGGWVTPATPRRTKPVCVVYIPSAVDVTETAGLTKAFERRRDEFIRRYPNSMILNAVEFGEKWQQYCSSLLTRAEFSKSVSSPAR